MDSTPLPSRSAAGTDSLRAAARWLLTAAAALLAVLVAGLQLTGLGALDGARLAVALVGAGTAIAAVGYVLDRACALLTAEWLTLTELGGDAVRLEIAPPTSRRGRRRQARLLRIQGDIELHREELFGAVADDVPDLHRRLAAANKAQRRPERPPGATGEPPPTGDPRALLTAAQAVVDFANYELTRERFMRLRKELAIAAVPTVAGILAFAYAAGGTP